jgi:hypothetical protein
MTVSREHSKYKIEFVEAQYVTLDEDGTKPVGERTFSHGKGNDSHELGT